MSYYFSKALDCSFEEATTRAKETLATRGFGVLSEIDVQAKLKEKLGVDMPRYLILGACNPKYAHQAILKENKIGTMLPCNVIVQERGDQTEVSAVDPIASMQAVNNSELGPIAMEVQALLKEAIESL